MKILYAISLKKSAGIAVAILVLSLLIYLPDRCFFLKKGVYNHAVIGIISNCNRSLIGHAPVPVTINEYDNSILYSDYIINQIIEIIKASNTDATITYVSNHGENLNDDSRHLYFHSYAPTKYTVHMPFFMWLSDSYIQKFPDKLKALQEYKQLPASSASNTFFTLLDLVHIEIKNAAPTRSLASLLFTGDPKKVIGEARYFRLRILNSEDNWLII